MHTRKVIGKFARFLCCHAPEGMDFVGCYDPTHRATERTAEPDEEGGSAAIGLAPGVLLHSRNVLLKTGLLIPAWTRRAAREATVRMGLKLLL